MTSVTLPFLPPTGSSNSQDSFPPAGSNSSSLDGFSNGPHVAGGPGVPGPYPQYPPSSEYGGHLPQRQPAQATAGECCCDGIKEARLMLGSMYWETRPPVCWDEGAVMWVFAVCVLKPLQKRWCRFMYLKWISSRHFCCSWVYTPSFSSTFASSYYSSCLTVRLQLCF